MISTQSIIMTNNQYRCLVAHMNYWKMGLVIACHDVGLGTDSYSTEEIIEQLEKAGYAYDRNSDTINYIY